LEARFHFVPQGHAIVARRFISVQRHVPILLVLVLVLVLDWELVVCQDGRGLNGASNRREISLVPATEKTVEDDDDDEDEKDSEMTLSRYGDLSPG
jgi:hypothetical protein